MDNFNVPISLLDHSYSRVRRVSARQAEGVRRSGACRQCPCCRDDQPRPQHSAAAAAASLPQKRKRRPARPSPRPSGPAAGAPGSVYLVEIPESAISPADLPVASTVAPGPRPPTAALHDDGPLKIHNRSVEEYQQIYREVVEGMLRYPTGRMRPYSLDLGRRIKHKLWERLERPTFTESVGEDGRVHVGVSYGSGEHPPCYEVDTLGEPSPTTSPQKRAKLEN